MYWFIQRRNGLLTDLHKYMFYIYKLLLLRLSFINLDKTIGKLCVKVKKEHLDGVDTSRSCQRRSYPCDFTPLIISFILPRPITHPLALYIPRLPWFFQNYRNNHRQFHQRLNYYTNTHTFSLRNWFFIFNYLFKISINLCVYVYL